MRSLLASLALAATLTLGACAPSIDAAAKADIDRRVATLSSSGAAIPAPSSATPMPMAVGQWATRTSLPGPLGMRARKRPSLPVVGVATTCSTAPFVRTRVATQTLAPDTP